MQLKEPLEGATDGIDGDKRDRQAAGTVDVSNAPVLLSHCIS